MNNRKKTILFLVFLFVILGAIGVYSYSTRSQDSKKLSVNGFTIPDAEKMANSAPVSECTTFDITLTVEEKNISERATNGAEVELLQLIWNLTIAPKEGIRVDNFFCSAQLNNWLVEKSVSPFESYMGLQESNSITMEYGSTKCNSLISTYIKVFDRNVSTMDSYYENLYAPISIMVSYDGKYEYYYVVPSVKTDTV